VVRLSRKTSLTSLKQNRMKSEFSYFAARLRERILSGGRVPRSPDFEISYRDRDSPHSCLQNDSDFNAFAIELFQLQYAQNAAYRKISETRGVKPRAVSHWSQIPTVPAATFKELDLTSILPANRTHVFHSSGTTEQRPSRHFHNADSLTVYEASLWQWFKLNVLGDLFCEIPNLRLIILAPPPARAANSSLVHMFETVRQHFGAPESAFLGMVGPDGTWTLDVDAALGRLKSDSGYRTSDVKLIVLSTAFSFVHLLDFLTAHSLRIQLPSGSRVMETGGYKGRSRCLPKAQLHKLLTERLGIPPSHIICEYGMSELSSQAYDSGPGDEWRVAGETKNHRHLSFVTRHFYFPPWARTQIISPETGREVAEGEIGLIRVFDLANVFSVMAIQTEDLGIRRGKGFELIGRAELAEPRGCSLMAV